MARYQVILAYDGTDFQGFQRQARSKNSRTVQAEVERLSTKWAGTGKKSWLQAGRMQASMLVVR